MTAGIAVATVHGPCTEAAVNHTPFCTAYQSFCETMMMGIGELLTYISDVLGTGCSSGAPEMTGVKVAVARSTVAVCGISLAMMASCACGVPGTEALTFSFRLSSVIWAKAGGRLVPATYCHGRGNPAARTRRPSTGSKVRR